MMTKARLQNFIRGAGSVMMIMPRESPPEFLGGRPLETEVEALHGDWVAVGSDISHALKIFSSRHQTNNTQRRSLNTE